ncbi:MAG TPA: hypothetical protein DCR93_19515 [Cytophagales bacterium]|nr:hypothetical protein [Cytophagales bacterium]HAP61589.1 hypothetical protein [Cytophagales bacterium]
MEHVFHCKVVFWFCRFGLLLLGVALLFNPKATRKRNQFSAQISPKNNYLRHWFFRKNIRF